MRTNQVISGLAAFLIAVNVATFMGVSKVSSQEVPPVSRDVVSALNNSGWSDLEGGINVIRAITQSGIVMTAFRISPEQFEFSIVTQSEATGSRAKEIGEREGAVLTTNAGFFAQNADGALYPIGFLRLNGETLSLGWENDGGVLTLSGGDLSLTPTHAGIPQNEENVFQSRPMLIEPSGKWAMASNLGELKNRSILCTMANGDVILALVTRVGMSLFEAGWIMRGAEVGGFFGCDAAMALDGGRSTQVWYSDDPKYSFPGLVPVHNFFVVRARQVQ